mmetsp:Transcript_13003/g.25835  ORF Transcript_13003/g.25835 Transcript_13003/m.25835 type:complete len:234 (+) Transcript_13003:201-902(+)|eukprot:CAMPEP_0182459774 /NCGR_PEP_ID=MMETSP1319-20130603/4826_1 /TAXON_ID=172717 /ORGANISM="Bolidomonas pacifica, Strain RCC208" /LENGTH=233 /DNA_ID=CAMNT_0024658759 /DNA_START=198 /DNA_END=899 /DNA_ORIENTATION=+
MGNLFRKKRAPNFTYSSLAAHIKTTNELWQELHPVVKQHVASLQAPQDALFIAPVSPPEPLSEMQSAKDPPIVPYDAVVEMVSTNPDLTLTLTYSIRIPLQNYVKISSLLLNLHDVLAAGHLLTSLPKVSYSGEFTDSERIRDYLRRNEANEYDRECIICLSSTSQTACNGCGVGVCNECDARWKAEEGRSGCPVCREVGEGFEFAEYGGQDMLENVREAARAIGDCFVNSVK